MSDYIKEIRKIERLTDEKTRELIISMREGNDNSRKKLIEHNLRLVVDIAYNYIYQIDLSIEDLVNAGSIGLMKAVDNFDFEMNTKLSTLAYHYIHNELRNLIAAYNTIGRGTHDEFSLEEEIKNTDGITVGDKIIDKGPSLEELFIEKDKIKVIQDLVEDLPQKDKELIYSRYGFIDGKIYTLDEIAKKEGVTRESIRMRQKKVLRNIKQSKNGVLIKSLI